MSRVTAEAMFAPLHQSSVGKSRQTEPDTPFAAFLDAPSGEGQAAGNISDSQDTSADPGASGEAEDERTGEEGGTGGAVVGIVGIVITPVSAPTLPIGQDLTVPGDPVASSELLGEASALSSPQNTVFPALPDLNNNADASPEVAPASPTGEPQSTSVPMQGVGIVVGDVNTPTLIPVVINAAPQPSELSAMQQAAAATAPTTSPAAAANVVSAFAQVTDGATSSVPGEDTIGESPQPKQLGGSTESFDAMLRKAGQTAADAADQPPGDTELPAAGNAKTVETSALQTSQPQPSPAPQAMPERFGHLTPAAPAAHTGQAATAETSAAVPLAGLALEIAARAHSGSSRFEIRLDPPELGRIDVRLDVDQRGQVTSRLVVEKAETLDLLKRDAPELERALQQAGLKTGDNGLQFALRDQSFAGRDDRPAQQMARVVMTDAELPAVEAAHSGYGRWLRADGGIDMRV